MFPQPQYSSAFPVFSAFPLEMLCGFDPRLALEKKNDTKSVSFFFSSPGRARKFDVYAPLRSAQSEVPRTSCAVSRSFITRKGASKWVLFFCIIKYFQIDR
nr:MAG TPA: hypothetical protein [Caudoviricetes sp.]